MKHFNIITGYDLISEAAVDIQHPVEGIPVEGWNKITEFTGGFREHEFTIFCAPTGSGKTQWLANLAAKFILQGVKTFFAPVETGHIDLMRRIFSVFGNYDFNAGIKPTPSMLANLKFVIEKNMDIVKENLFVSTHDNRVDINEMISTLKYVNEIHGVKIAILDNLNFFMKPTRAADQILEYDEVIHSFVMLAKEIPIHLILVMHPRKTDGKITDEMQIKGSSTSVQEATNVLLMNRLNEDEYNDFLGPLHREFVFRKIRRRGAHVGTKFYMQYENGKYVDTNSARSNSPLPKPKNNSRPISSGLPYVD